MSYSRTTAYSLCISALISTSQHITAVFIQCHLFNVSPVFSLEKSSFFFYYFFILSSKSQAIFFSQFYRCTPYSLIKIMVEETIYREYSGTDHCSLQQNVNLLIIFLWIQLFDWLWIKRFALHMSLICSSEWKFFQLKPIAMSKIRTIFILFSYFNLKETRK